MDRTVPVDLPPPAAGRARHHLVFDVEKTRGEPVTEIRFHADDPER